MLQTASVISYLKTYQCWKAIMIYKMSSWFYNIFWSNFSYFSQQQYFSNKQFPVNWSSLTTHLTPSPPRPYSHRPSEGEKVTATGRGWHRELKWLDCLQSPLPAGPDCLRQLSLAGKMRNRFFCDETRDKI